MVVMGGRGGRGGGASAGSRCGGIRGTAFDDGDLFRRETVERVDLRVDLLVRRGDLPVERRLLVATSEGQGNMAVPFQPSVKRRFNFSCHSSSNTTSNRTRVFFMAGAKSAQLSPWARSLQSSKTFCL